MPGIDWFKGSIIRYRGKKQTDSGGLSRRDAPAINRASVQYVSDIPAPISQRNDSYFGYAVTSGYFLETSRDKLLYVASAPQANYQQGEVNLCLLYLFAINIVICFI